MVDPHFHKQGSPEGQVSEKDVIPDDTVLPALPTSGAEGVRAVIDDGGLIRFYRFIKGAWREMGGLGGADISTMEKGSLIVGNGSGTAGILPIGTDGTVPIADSSQAEGIRWDIPPSTKIGIDYADVNVVNTTVETTLISYNIAAGTLSTRNAIRARLYINGFDNNGAGNSVTLRLKYGGTTLITLSGLETVSGKTLHGYVDIMLLARGATNSQEGTLSVHLLQDKLTQNPAGAPDAIFALADGTSAVNSNQIQTFAVTAQWNIANAANNFGMGWATIEKLY